MGGVGCDHVGMPRQPLTAADIPISRLRGVPFVSELTELLWSGPHRRQTAGLWAFQDAWGWCMHWWHAARQHKSLQEYVLLSASVGLSLTRSCPVPAARHGCTQQRMQWTHRNAGDTIRASLCMHAQLHPQPRRSSDASLSIMMQCGWHWMQNTTCRAAAGPAPSHRSVATALRCRTRPRRW